MRPLGRPRPVCLWELVDGRIKAGRGNGRENDETARPSATSLLMGKLVDGRIKAGRYNERKNDGAARPSATSLLMGKLVDGRIKAGKPGAEELDLFDNCFVE